MVQRMLQWRIELMIEEDESKRSGNSAKESQDKHADSHTDSDDLQGDRRANLRRLLVGGGVIGSSAIVPDKWSKAVVESVMLPAHAQSSGVSSGNFNGQGPAPG